MDFFLHGSMSTEVVPEAVLRAFIKTYPDLFPTADLSHLGLIPDPAYGWPIGFSRKPVKHLGELPTVGINCASCHVVQITSSSSRVHHKNQFESSASQVTLTLKPFLIPF